MCWNLTPWDAGRQMMAKVEFKGIDEVVTSLTELSKLPDEVIDAMLNARADVVVEAQREEARKLGKEYRNRKQKKDYSKGLTARSIQKGKVKVKDGQRVLYITPVGSRKRGKIVTRNAEIAFLNEFGTKTIQARNFLRKANEQSADAATAAEFEVYSRYLKEKGL
jgi:HK97 gp10 family phage protein